MYSIKDADKLIISVYGSHNASVVMYYKGEYTIVEVERWINQKNSGLTMYAPCLHPQIVFDEIITYLLSNTDRSHVDIYMSNYADKLEQNFTIKERIGFDHHTAHAATAFYQSPYDEMLVFTFDGGGNGGYFNVYLASRDKGIELIQKFDQDLGYPYMLLSHYLEDIKKEPLNIGNLVYAGKLMGLCSYGKVIPEWVPHFEEYYEKFYYSGNAFMGGNEVRPEALKTLFAKLKLPFDMENSRFSGQTAWDIAATTQQAFENQFFKKAKPFMEQYPNLPIGLSGGCALNVLLNKKILDQKRDNKVFVPPNTNDCGIAVGGILWYLKPKEQVDLTYTGLPILDSDNIGHLINKYYLELYDDVTIEELAMYLNDGHIVGVIQGNSEHGSRALGNRSIICDPRDGMKDILNEKVKKREWYRPFAPMVRLEDAPTYFDIPEGVESRHMVFVATVKDEWAEKLSSIRHEDGTGRLQTIAKDQNPFIYNLLGEFGKLSGHNVLLNTSFNVNGKPILSRLDDAFKLLSESDLDAVFFDNKLFFKHYKSKTFKIIRDQKTSSKLNKDTTVVLYYFGDSVESSDIDKINHVKNNIDKQIVIMTNDEIHQHFKVLESDTCKIHSVKEGRKYFMKQIFDREATLLELSKLIKCLWFKEVVRENLFNNDKHLFIDIQSNKMNVNHVIEALSNNVSNMTYATGYSRTTGNSIFEHIIKKYDRNITDKMNLDILYGTNDNISNISSMYEAYLIAGIQEQQIGTEQDYLDFALLEFPNIKIFRVY